MSLSFKHFLWAPLALVAVLALFSELAGGQHVPTDEELEESYNQEMHEWEATLSPKCAAEGITPIKAFDIMERCEAQKALDEYIQLQLANDKKLQKKCGSTIVTTFRSSCMIKNRIVNLILLFRMTSGQVGLSEP